MPRACNSCGIYKSCVYRGIINPCDNWVTSFASRTLRSKAKAIAAKPMSMTEAQFVTSATTLESFTPKQASWLRSIYARVG